MYESFNEGEILWTTSSTRSLGDAWNNADWSGEPVEVVRDTDQGDSWTNVRFLHGYVHERTQISDPARRTPLEHAAFYWHFTELSRSKTEKTGVL